MCGLKRRIYGDCKKAFVMGYFIDIREFTKCGVAEGRRLEVGTRFKFHLNDKAWSTVTRIMDYSFCYIYDNENGTGGGGIWPNDEVNSLIIEG